MKTIKFKKSKERETIDKLLVRADCYNETIKLLSRASGENRKEAWEMIRKLYPDATSYDMKDNILS